MLKNVSKLGSGFVFNLLLLLISVGVLSDESFFQQLWDLKKRVLNYCFKLKNTKTRAMSKMRYFGDLLQETAISKKSHNKRSASGELV